MRWLVAAPTGVAIETRAAAFTTDTWIYGSVPEHEVVLEFAALVPGAMYRLASGAASWTFTFAPDAQWTPTIEINQVGDPVDRVGPPRRCATRSRRRPSRSDISQRWAWHAPCTASDPERRPPMPAITDKMKGKAKRAEGKLTGDRIREAQGSAEETKGEVEGRIDRMKNRVRSRVSEAKAKRNARKATRAR